MYNYNSIQKFLHDFVLNKKFINKSLFEIEKIIYLKNKDMRNQSHVFITGMPRSGTTLVEQIISSHSDVTAAGELKDIGHYGGLLSRGVTPATTETISEFRLNYLNELRKRSGGNSLISDKLPQNFR